MLESGAHNGTSPIRLKLQTVEVRSSKVFAGAFEAIIKERAQALLFFPEVVFSGNLARIVEFSSTNKLASVFEGNASVETGGLMSYGPSSTGFFSSGCCVCKQDPEARQAC